MEGFGKMAAASLKIEGDIVTPEINDELNVLEAIVHSNMSLCSQKLGNAASALEQADLAVKANPSYCKAYVRKAEAILMTKNYEKALMCFDAALSHALEEKERDHIMKAKAKAVEMDHRAVQQQEKRLRGFLNRESDTSTVEQTDLK